jgi:putative sigma-54 modulation protein
MNLNIKASKTTLTPAIQQGIEAKLSVLTDFLKPEHKLYVEIEADASHDLSQQFRAEISIQPDGHFAEASAGDMYEAIDLLVPKIRQQLSRDKDKKVSLRRKLGVLKRFWNRGR